MQRDLIDIYEDGGRKLAKSVVNLTQHDFAVVPVAGKWSIQQLIVHVADADLVMADRMKRLIAEPHPTLLAFDENLWIQNLHYELQPAQEVLELFAVNRRVMSNLLRVLPPEAMQRSGTHTERGEITLEKVLQTSVDHLDHHLKFLYEKLEKLGKLMW